MNKLSHQRKVLNNLKIEATLQGYILAYYLKNKLLKNKSKNIIISSYPRGGSTWLLELFLQTQASYPIFEPLNSAYHPELLKFKLSRHEYVPEHAEWPELYQFFSKLLSHTLPWKSYFFAKNFKHSWRAEHYVIKCVFANMMLPWLVRNFDITPILLVRHPCAVISSQLKHPSFMKKIDQNTLSKDIKFPEIYNEKNGWMLHLETVEEKLAAAWALNTKVALLHPKNDKKWITVFYENLYSEGEEGVIYLFNKLKLDAPRSVIENFHVPSKTTYGKSSEKIQSGQQLTSWRNQLSNKQIELILKTTHKAGVTLYTEDIYPN